MCVLSVNNIVREASAIYMALRILPSVCPVAFGAAPPVALSECRVRLCRVVRMGPSKVWREIGGHTREEVSNMRFGEIWL